MIIFFKPPFSSGFPSQPPDLERNWQTQFLAECAPAIQIHAETKNACVFLRKFGSRSSSCQQAASLREMFFHFTNSMITKCLRLWFWNLHKEFRRAMWNIVKHCETINSDMNIMTSCCWPCSGPPKKRSIRAATSAQGSVNASLASCSCRLRSHGCRKL